MVDGKERVVLGSGKLYVKLYEGTTPTKTDLLKPENLLGTISGGATLEYKPNYYSAKDDLGLNKKTVLVDEEATLKTGIMTWNGKTLEKICDTATVTEEGTTRTVKIGGASKQRKAKYAIMFIHEDEEDGDVWVIIVGNNVAGFAMTFAKDKETVIDAEFQCNPLDETGTLIIFEEEIPEVQSVP